MIKKALPALASGLFILGASTLAYSDSLPGVAALAGPNATCITHSVAGDPAIYNNCGTAINVWVPLVSRTTGTFKFYATAPGSDFTSCTLYARDYSGNVVFTAGPTALSGNTQIGSSSFSITGPTVLYYNCNLYNGGRLQSVNSAQQ